MDLEKENEKKINIENSEIFEIEIELEKKN